MSTTIPCKYKVIIQVLTVSISLLFNTGNITTSLRTKSVKEVSFFPDYLFILFYVILLLYYFACVCTCSFPSVKPLFCPFICIHFIVCIHVAIVRNTSYCCCTGGSVIDSGHGGRTHTCTYAHTHNWVCIVSYKSSNATKSKIVHIC